MKDDSTSTMTRSNTKLDAMKADAVPELGTIQIMRGVFRPNESPDLFTGLEADGYHYSMFEDIGVALLDQSAKLLLLGATDENCLALILALQAESSNVQGAPVLVHFNVSQQNMERMFVPEIDDFFLDRLDGPNVRLRINRLLQLSGRRENEFEQARLNLTSRFGMGQLIGQSPAFLDAIDRIPRVAASDAVVLLRGETGTGKELCARAIHYLSSRANKPFVPINCGSIPSELFENELFGHQSGAFTGASHSRSGLIAEAEGGTLFLDEVDSLPLLSQVKLLRFLQDGEYKPLGASTYRQANVRLIAATNQDLLEKVRSGEFREDLYYRLRVILLCLPLLRDRQEDIGPLALHFLRSAVSDYRGSARRFSQDAVRKMSHHTWPGNVRELENVIREAVVGVDGLVIRARHLHLASDTNLVSPFREPLSIAKTRVVEEFERNYLIEALTDAGGNISEAARAASKDRRTFFGLLKKYGLVAKSLTEVVE